ncbi:GAF and ANTAR domain-containing protein [Streptomyces sp. N2-109]|uniref:GAF and ANTAR domain-containing protein n=1 Tax=Streptomyces gossypii TaxID=2883101 RepID=A0ABT2JVG1_9ACTN|nr:GAF and ANTAR domain-containing protein [Streptomyces gossypii]MCT2591439.1 GAF and ANTAR domain-containing protein [Streptomyces gossypii]
MARACRACAELLTVGDGVSFALIGDRQHRETLYASGSTANVLEELQYTLGEGPCFEAFESGGPVLVPDVRTAAPPRWPTFAHAVEEHEVAGLFVFPLGWGAIRIGAMSVYRGQPGPLSVDELATVLQIADVAVWALLMLHQSPSDIGAVNWTDETASHRQVHQATGVLMARLDVPAADAIALMRAHAFLIGALIGEVAADVLDGRLRLGSDEP